MCCNNDLLWFIILFLILFCGCGNSRNSGCGCDTHHVTHAVANKLAVLIFFNSYTYAI